MDTKVDEITRLTAQSRVAFLAQIWDRVKQHADGDYIIIECRTTHRHTGHLLYQQETVYGDDVKVAEWED